MSHVVKFKREILPGEKFEIKTTVNSWSRGICIGKGSGYVNGELACEADMTITIPEILEQYLPKKIILGDKEKNNNYNWSRSFGSSGSLESKQNFWLSNYLFRAGRER